MPLIYILLGYVAAVVFNKNVAENRMISLAAQEQIKANARELDTMAAIKSMQKYADGTLVQWWADHRDCPGCTVKITPADVERIKQQILQQQAIANLAQYDQGYLPNVYLPNNQIINITGK